jgi:hypothetical protein
MTSRMRLVISTAATLFVLVMGAVVAGCTSTPTVTTSAQGEYRLAYDYQSGDTLVFEVTQTDKTTTDEELLEAGQSAISTDVYVSRVTATVKSVDDNGVATVQVKDEQTKNTTDGVKQTLNPITEATLKIAPTGRVVSVEGFDGLGAQVKQTGDIGPVLDYLDVGYALENVIYPEDGLAKVGEEWSDEYTITLPGMTEVISVKTKAKLTSVVKEGGKQIAVIDYTYELLPFTFFVDMSEAIREEARANSYQGDLAALVYKMSMTGAQVVSGQARMDLATGQPVSINVDLEMSASFTLTDAPADLFPLDQRGPYGMTATGTGTMTRVK